jgi:hypothetical protein
LQASLQQVNKEKLAMQMELSSQLPPNPQTNAELTECVNLQQAELSKLRAEVNFIFIIFEFKIIIYL